MLHNRTNKKIDRRKLQAWMLILAMTGTSLLQDVSFASDVVPGGAQARPEMPQAHVVQNDAEWYETNEDARPADQAPVTFDAQGNGKVRDASGRVVKIVHGRGASGWTLVGYHKGTNIKSSERIFGQDGEIQTEYRFHANGNMSLYAEHSQDGYNAETYTDDGRFLLGVSRDARGRVMWVGRNTLVFSDGLNRKVSYEEWSLNAQNEIRYTKETYDFNEDRVTSETVDGQGRLLIQIDTRGMVFELYPGLKGRATSVKYQYGADGSRTVEYEGAFLDDEIALRNAPVLSTAGTVLPVAGVTAAPRRRFITPQRFFKKYDAAGALTALGGVSGPSNVPEYSAWTLRADRVEMALGSNGRAVQYLDGRYTATWPDGMSVTKEPNGREEYFYPNMTHKIYDPNGPVLYLEYRWVNGQKIKFREFFNQPNAAGAIGYEYDAYGRVDLTHALSSTYTEPTAIQQLFVKHAQKSYRDSGHTSGMHNIGIEVSPYTRTVQTKYLYVADPAHRNNLNPYMPNTSGQLAITAETTAEQMAAKLCDLTWDYIATGSRDLGPDYAGTGLIPRAGYAGAVKLPVKAVYYSGIGSSVSIPAVVHFNWPVTTQIVTIAGERFTSYAIGDVTRQTLDCAVSDCSSRNVSVVSNSRSEEMMFNARGDISHLIIRDTAAGTVETYDYVTGTHTRAAADGSWVETYGTVTVPFFSVPGQSAAFGGSGDGYIRTEGGRVVEAHVGGTTYRYSGLGILTSVKVGAAAAITIDPSILKIMNSSDTSGAVGYEYDAHGRAVTTYMATGEKVLTSYHFDNASDWNAASTARRKDARKSETILGRNGAPVRVLTYSSKASFLAAEADDAGRRAQQPSQPQRAARDLEYVRWIVLPDGTQVDCNTSDCAEYMLGLGVRQGWGLATSVRPSVALIEAGELGGDHHQFVAGLIGALNSTETAYRTKVGTDANGRSIYQYYDPLTESFMSHAQAASANAAIDQIMLQADLGHEVINLSLDFDTSALSRGQLTDVMERMQAAVDHARSAGAIVVAAAGNRGEAGLGLLAGLDGVISVGSIDFAGRRSSFSSTGSRIDFVAVGEGLVSRTAAAIGYWSGTSFAAPQLALTIGKMIAYDKSRNQGRRTLRESDIMDILKETSTDLGAAGHDSSFGWGLFNPRRAIERMVGWFNARIG